MDNHGKRLEGILTSLRQQWGYNYGTGNTVIYSSNSPAGWLKSLMEYNKEEYYDGYTYSTAKYLAFIFREAERQNARLNYNGSLVGGDSGDYSAARLLARVHNALYGNVTYAETGNGGVRSAVSVLGYIANLIYYGNNDLAMVAGRNLYRGGLVGADSTDNLFSTARILARIHNALYGEVTLHETGGTSVRSAVGMLGYLSNLVYDTHYSNGKYLETGTSGKRSLADIALYAANLIYDSSYSQGELLETGMSGKRSLADLLRYTANLVYLSKEKLNQISGFMQADSSFFSKGFADVLAKLGDIEGAVGADVSVDNSGVESRLDKIANLLLAAGAVENTKDIIDALVGDLDFSNLAAMSSEMETALSNAFPFCIPAVLKQVLGLVRAEPEAPVWEFDIAGSPLVVDFAPFRPVADVMGWCLRVGFTLVLLANTRKFVYMGGGAAES